MLANAACSVTDQEILLPAFIPLTKEIQWTARVSKKINF